MIAFQALVGCSSTSGLIADSRAEDPETRRYAVLDLAERRPNLTGSALSSAAQAVVGRLGDDDPAVRATAVEALASFPVEDPDSLASALLEDDHAMVRMAAIQALQGLKAKEMCPLFLDLAEKDPDSWVRLAAVNALADLGDLSHVKRLIDLLETEESGVRYAINDVLRRLTGQRLPPVGRKWRDWYEQQRNRS